MTVLAIDQGTTNSKALLVGPDGSVLGKGSAPVAVTVSGDGRVEQDGDELWHSVRTAVARAVDAAATGTPAVTGVAISNQRESVLAWSRRSGRPVGPAIGWQDARTSDWCRELTATRPDAPGLVADRTGLRLDAMFSAPKLNWLLRRGVDDHPVDDICVGTIDAWLIWQLTGGRTHACETGNASRTLLLDLHGLDWSPELLDLFDLPSTVLPEIRPSDAGFGETRGLADLGRPGLALPDGLPVLAVLADSHAALFGQGGEQGGVAKATYGTGSSVMVPLDRLEPVTSGGAATVPAVPAVSTTVAWARNDGSPTGRATYAREGNILSTGSALAWTARLLGCADVAGLVALAADGDGGAGVQLVPALTGLGAPHWDRDARAAVLGMGAGTTRADVARAAVAAVGHQVCDVVEVIEDGQGPIGVLRADGGVTVSGLAMQTQADLLGRLVQVGAAAELSALGAARLAWSAATGQEPWPIDPGSPDREPDQTPDPTPDQGSGRPMTYRPVLDPGSRAEHRTRWRDAVATIRSSSRRMA